MVAFAAGLGVKMRRCCLVVWLLLLATVLPNAAHAQSRVALVVGNSAYQNVVALPNPLNDAGDIGAALRRLNFDVTTITNARYDDMRRALIGFGQKARGSEIAIVYFAGHGMEIGGENYLIPVDAQLAGDLDVPNEAIGLQSLMRAVSNSAKLGLVILDACRNNPFLPKMQRTSLTRAAERGFARVEPSGNILVAYAAREGTTANDGSGRNSPFTNALLKNIETPGLEIGNLFRAVREDVMTATGNGQQPFVYGSLAKELIFLKPAGNVAAPPASASLVSPPAAETPMPSSPPPSSPAVRPLAPSPKARLTSSMPRSLEAGEDGFTKRLREIAGNRIDVTVFYAGEIVPGLQALDAVSNGTVEMAWTLGEYYAAKDPAFKLLSGIPFGFDPMTHVAWRSQSDVAATIDGFLAGYNVVAVPCGLFGDHPDFASRKDIRAVSDLTGLKLRAGGMVGQILAKAGVVNQAIAGGDVYDALRKGAIDAAVWADPNRLEKVGFQKVAPNIYYPGMVTPGTVIDLLISAGFWKSLGTGGQQLVREACADNLRSMDALTLASNKAAVGRMASSGARVAPLPRNVQRALVACWDELAAEYSGKNKVFKTLLDSAARRREQLVSSSIRQ